MSRCQEGRPAISSSEMDAGKMDDYRLAPGVAWCGRGSGAETANHPRSRRRLRNEAVRGPSGIAGPCLYFGPYPHALSTTAGRYGMTE